MAKITGVYAEVGKDIEVLTFENELEPMQKLIGGYLETVHLFEDVYMIVNEEGMILELPPNFIPARVTSNGVQPLQMILGNVLFVSVVGSEFASLDKLQIQKIKKMFSFGRNSLVLNADQIR